MARLRGGDSQAIGPIDVQTFKVARPMRSSSDLFAVH